MYPEGESEAIVTQDVIRIRVARDRIAPSFLAAYLNSPIGKRNGGLSTFHSADLLATVQKEVVERSRIDPVEMIRAD